MSRSRMAPPIRVKPSSASMPKSTNPNPKPDPVIYVAGGGGVNQLYYSEHYLNNGGDEILKDRDYIMYNQRGAQLNEPSLVCPDNTDLYWTLAKQNLSARERADHKIGKLLECQECGTRMVTEPVNQQTWNMLNKIKVNWEMDDTIL